MEKMRPINGHGANNGILIFFIWKGLCWEKKVHLFVFAIRYEFVEFVIISKQEFKETLSG